MLIPHCCYVDVSLQHRLAYEKRRALELQDRFRHESIRKLAQHIADDADLLSQILAGHSFIYAMTAVEFMLTRRRMQLEEWLETLGRDAILLG